MPPLAFGDRVRVRTTDVTQRARIAGLEGQIYGHTTPSVTGVQVIGTSPEDIAINVNIEGHAETYWLAPDQLEFIDHGHGTEVRLAGVDKSWVRDSDGAWNERHDARLQTTARRGLVAWVRNLLRR